MSSHKSNYLLAVLLDQRRLALISRTQLEGAVKEMYGGAIKSLILEVTPPQAQEILSQFTSARIDARRFIEEVPVAFKKILFEEIVRASSISEDVIDAVLRKMPEIKAAASKEEEYLPPPEV